MTTDDSKKQFAIRLTGFQVITGVHHLNIFGAISGIEADNPSVLRFDSREQAQKWVDSYNSRPFCAFAATIIEL